MLRSLACSVMMVVVTVVGSGCGSGMEPTAVLVEQPQADEAPAAPTDEDPATAPAAGTADAARPTHGKIAQHQDPTLR